MHQKLLVNITVILFNTLGLRRKYLSIFEYLKQRRW